MLDWLSSIGDTFSVIIQFVTTTINGIISLFTVVGPSFSFLRVAIGYLPSVLFVYVIAGITITIFLHLIGR